MAYKRPKLLEPGFPVFSTKIPYGDIPVILPKFDTPITPRENFIRAAKRDKPMWMPNLYSDMQELQPFELARHRPGKFAAGPDFRRASKEDYKFIDPYGSSWTWVAEAQGAMLTPGTKILEDITEWEKVVKWPNLDEWTYAEVAKDFLDTEYDDTKALNVNIYQGVTEMLVAFLGGYGEGMLAMAEEPEAVSDFFESFIDNMIAYYDFLKKLYPFDMVTYHDDWGTQRATFFSPKMFEDLVYKPTKRLVDHVKADGVLFLIHTCGNIEKFMPYACEIGFDFLQIQRNAVDLPKLKEQYGDKIGFMTTLDGHTAGSPYTVEQVVEMARNNVDLYAKGGGYYPWIFETGEETLWALASELYCYSREYYDKEQGR
ncbi:MAG: hypothetical protein FWB97_01885 [Oscillospiraceae bacterium]|nr:hypothetical protein [Oscillospiraceae bacterium]